VDVGEFKRNIHATLSRQRTRFVLPRRRKIDCMLLGNSSLSAEAVALVIKQRIAAIGLDPTEYSGHSLRAGFVTSAAQAGVPIWRIRQQTGHTSDSILQRYIREAELFVQNDAGALL
jgi:integrase